MLHAFVTSGLIGLAAMAGVVAQVAGLPLPFLLGPLLSVGLVAALLPHRLPAGYAFPPGLRVTFIAVIGMMIGARVTPELFVNSGRLVASLAALTLFVGLAHAWNYQVFRRLGRYDRETAYYSATPGGLYESIAMGEEAGADMSRLILQQFLRIIVVVTALPIGLSLWLGEPVGSASGVVMGKDMVPWHMLPELLLAGAAGIMLGRWLRLPAGQLIGPLAISAALSLSGWAPLEVPQWLVNAAQIVVGTALGMRFTGLSRGLVLRGAGLALLSVAGMMTLAGAMAAALMPLVGESFDVLLISFAPGGVTEMALIALSLHANPALVTLHHVYRIMVTVVFLVVSHRIRRRL